MPGVMGTPWSSDKESWLCHPSREGLTSCLTDALVSALICVVTAQLICFQCFWTTTWTIPFIVKIRQ